MATAGAHDIVNNAGWVTVYPAYCDRLLSIGQGRRIAKEKACPAPFMPEMAQVCAFLHLEARMEPDKQYPRDVNRGRLQVHLKDGEGDPVNPEVPSKRVLLEKMGELMPRLQSRQERLKKLQEAQAQAQAQAQRGRAAAGSGGSTGNRKKKGKKKKR